MIKAAKNFREGGQPEQALTLLESLAANGPLKDMNLEGSRGLELGACYKALHEPEKALAAYLNAAFQSAHIVDNSDIVRRIVKLGGVPLRSDREVDVRYFRPAAPLSAHTGQGRTSAPAWPATGKSCSAPIVPGSMCWIPAPRPTRRFRTPRNRSRA